MGKPGRPYPGLDEYLYWQERLANREASGLSIDAFCADEDVSRSTYYRWLQNLKGGIPDAVREEAADLATVEITEAKFLPISVTTSPIEIGDVPLIVKPDDGLLGKYTTAGMG